MAVRENPEVVDDEEGFFSLFIGKLFTNVFLVTPLKGIEQVIVHRKEAIQLKETGRYSIRQLLTIMASKGLQPPSGKRLSLSSSWNIVNKEK